MATASSSEARIVQLEQQVKSLTETVNAMYDALYCDRRGVPRVREMTTISDTADPKQAIDQATEASSETLQRFLKPTVPSEPVGRVESLETYGYTALNPDSHEIRVIGLHTAKSVDDPIQCDLHTVALDDIGPPHVDWEKGVLKYPLATLSYTWGDATSQELIVVNGRSLSVTKNLYTALKHFRDSPEHSVLRDKWRLFWWIDAVCINQKDLDERKSQVGLMTRLYRNATVGHVWLGPEGDGSTKAMSVVRKLGYSPKTAEQRSAWEYKKKKGEKHQQMGPGLPPRALDEEPAPPPASDKADNYDALIKLFNRAWFSRVWVRQEFALPGDINFHCGHEVCTWQEMTKAAMVLSILADVWKVDVLQRDDMRTAAPLVSCFRRVEELRQLRERLISLRKFNRAGEKTFLTMRHVLFHARDSNATDPRDKVYSMLPLTNPSETQLVADYRISHLEVYKAAALDMAPTSLNFLCACQHVPEDGNLPSWVPDLSRSWQCRPTIGYLEADGRFPDSKDFRYASPQYQYFPDGEILEAEGVISDSISLICESTSANAPSPADLEFLRNAWSKFYTENVESSRHTTNLTELSWDALDPKLEILETSTRFSFHKGNHDLYTVATSNNPFTPDPIGVDSSEVRAARNLLPDFDLPTTEGESTKDRTNRRKKSQSPNLVVGRKFAKTAGGAFGFVPAGAEIDDLVCHFKGSLATFIIRKKSDGTGNLLIGDARLVLQEKNYIDIDRLPFQKIRLV